MQPTIRSFSHIAKQTPKIRQRLAFSHSRQSVFPLQQQIRKQSSPSTAAWPYIYRQQASPKMAPQLDSFFKQVDSMAESFIDRLAKAVAIPSVSADDDKRPEVVRVCNRFLSETSSYALQAIKRMQSPLFL